MNAAIARNTHLTTVAICPIGCLVGVPLTTMNTAGQGRNCAAQESNRDGTHPVYRDHFPTPAEANPSWSGGRYE